MPGVPCCPGNVEDLAAVKGGIERRTQAMCGGVGSTGVGEEFSIRTYRWGWGGGGEWSEEGEELELDM